MKFSFRIQFSSQIAFCVRKGKASRILSLTVWQNGIFLSFWASHLITTTSDTSPEFLIRALYLWGLSLSLSPLPMSFWPLLWPLNCVCGVCQTFGLERPAFLSCGFRTLRLVWQEVGMKKKSLLCLSAMCFWPCGLGLVDAGNLSDIFCSFLCCVSVPCSPVFLNVSQGSLSQNMMQAKRVGRNKKTTVWVKIFHN